jgi:mannose-1-phosphate guanylyltransferase
MPHNYGLILAGGRGTRFWPRSRRKHSKQVLSVLGERTLIQQTVDRLKPVLAPEHLWVLTNADLQDEIIRQIPEVPRLQIIAEPVARNTAPAIGLAGRILASIDPDAVMGVFSADQIIGKPARYLRAVRAAFRAAGQGRIAVLGIQPRWPETGYGYIEFAAGAQAGKPAPVRKFREKPDLATARRYVKSGRFYWNAGMFFWRASVLNEALQLHLPRTATLLSALPRFGDRRFPARLREIFPQCEKISIDYAVLEKASGVIGVPCEDIGWSDVGSWNAVYELLPRDAAGNVSRGDTLLVESAGNYIDAKGKLVALLGVENLVIVDTPDALLVASRAQAQRVGKMVEELERRKREDLL